ncbi:MAG: HAMP domain-containing histidine kinase [Anaerolineae bacterium]|jgi:signal transduction histidine kinase|nr:HAMP domain-containing histidine kinase [Anaerolineae bacterium]
MTIRTRLTLWYAGLLTVIIMLLGTSVYAVMRWTLVSGIDQTLDDTTTQIRQNSRFVIIPAFVESPQLRLELPELDFFRASGVEVQVWSVFDGHHNLEDSSANLEAYTASLDPAALGTSEPRYADVHLNRVLWRVRTSPIVVGDRLVGNIQVAASLEGVSRAAQILLVVVLVSCTLAIIGSTLLSRWLAHRVLRPIENITRTASHVVGTKDLALRLEWSGPMDELGQLNAVFNQMMERLEKLFTVQQRFVADVSHELRTPITAICGNLEMIRRYGMDDESLDAINKEAERLKRLVNDLLLLARADYGGIDFDLYPLELDTIVMDSYRSGLALTKERQLTLKVLHIEPLRIQGNGDRLRQLMLNLLDNAVKFTPNGGTITLSLRQKGEQAVIEVADTGIGIQPDDLERIFDRFYQSDPSRVHNGGGFGLGLSIAKWIVDSHHGEISAHSTYGQGTTFVVTFPLFDPTGDREQSTPYQAATRPNLAIIKRPTPKPKSTTE